MREWMRERLKNSMRDRKTIIEFVEWLEVRNGGKVSILLPSGSPQEVNVESDLDDFHDIDRQRLEDEKKRYG